MPEEEMGHTWARVAKALWEDDGDYGGTGMSDSKERKSTAQVIVPMHEHRPASILASAPEGVELQQFGGKLFSQCCLDAMWSLREERLRPAIKGAILTYYNDSSIPLVERILEAIEGELK